MRHLGGERYVRPVDEPTHDPEGTAPLPVLGGGGVLPGVDLEDGRRLADLLDAETSLDALR